MRSPCRCCSVRMNSEAFQKRKFMRSRVDPSMASRQPFNMHFVSRQIGSIDVSNFQFTTRGRPERAGDFDPRGCHRNKAR